MASKVDPTQPVNAWLYRQGGEAAVGYGGSLVIRGDRLFVALNGQSGLLTALPDGEVPEVQGPAAPRYVEISAADFPDKESVQGAERVILVWWGLLSDPYHALKAMRPEAGVERGADGPTFTVRGIVRSDDLCRPYLGAATDWAMELGYMVRIEIPVTLTVDAWGRPLETNVAYFGDLVTAQRFGWVRGVWEVEPSQVMGVSEYLDHSEGNLLASYLGGTFTLPAQVGFADIIVYGVVTDVLPGRWNSPDGTQWQGPNDASTASVIYRTFYVEPIEILKGQPAFGAPVAFMAEGGIKGEISGPVNTGDTVLVFARYEPNAYGGTWLTDAYRSTHGEWSIFKETDSVLTNLFVLGGWENQIADEGFDRVTLEDVRAEVAGGTSAQ